MEEHKLTVRMHRRIRCTASTSALSVGLINIWLWLLLHTKSLLEDLKTTSCSCSVWADSDVDAFSDLSDEHAM